MVREQEREEREEVDDRRAEEPLRRGRAVVDEHAEGTGREQDARHQRADAVDRAGSPVAQGARLTGTRSSVYATI